VAKNKIWTRPFILLMLSLLFIASANYYFASTIAVYAKLITNSGLYAGIVTSAFYASSVGMRLVNGVLVQKYGSLPLMILSAALCAVACFAHRYAATIFVLIMLRALHGIGYSMFNTASGTAASFLVPRERITEGIGYFAIGNVLALALGPAMALAIIGDFTRAEFNTLFLVAFLFCLAAFILAIHIYRLGKIEEIPKKVSLVQEKLPPTFLGFEKGVVIPVIVTFMLTFSYASAFVYLAAYGLSKGWGNIGNAYFMYAMGLLVSRLFVGKLGDKYGPDYVMLPVFILTALALSGIALCSSLWELYLAMVVLGMCIGSFNPEMNVFCILRCSVARRGTATAAFNGSSDLGLAAGSAVAGLCVEQLGYTFVFLAGSVGAILTLIVYSFTLSNFKKKALPF